MRCTFCSATNPDESAWCNQCFNDLRSHEPAHAGDEDGQAKAGAPPERKPAGQRNTRDVRPSSTQGDFTVVDGTPIPGADHGSGPGSEGPRPQAIDLWGGQSEWTPQQRNRAVLANAILPGLGHLLSGWTASGLARLVLYTVWLLGGLLMVSAGGTVVAVPLLIGAAILWAAGLHDAWQLSQRGPQLLSGRALLWLVVGVSVLAMLGVVGVAVSVTASG